MKRFNTAFFPWLMPLEWVEVCQCETKDEADKRILTEIAVNGAAFEYIIKGL